MNDIQQLFREVIEQALELKIPVSDALDSEVRINPRPKARYGMCVLKNGVYTIEISEFLLDAPERLCRDTLAHEILHTCRGCMNHQKKWKQYANLMNNAYGYDIKTKCPPIAGTEACRESIKHILKCALCGREYARRRRSKLIKNPEKYRCVCGGELYRAHEQ